MLQRVFAGLCALSLALAPTLAQGAEAAKPFLGVAVGPLEANKDATPVIRELADRGPAAKAGLKKGDILVKVGDQAVKNPEEVVQAVAKAKVGDKLSIQVQRAGKDETVVVTLEERKAEAPAVERKDARIKGSAFLGVWAQPITAELKEKMGLSVEKGVLVSRITPVSPAAKAGLMKDDVITAINDQAIASPDDLRKAVQTIGAGREATVKFLRGKDAREMKVQLEEMPLGMLWDLPMLKDRLGTDLPPGVHAEWQRRIEEMEKRFRELLQEDTVPPVK